jgi:hypothetical protein
MKIKALLSMLFLMLISSNALSQNTIYGTVSGDAQAGIDVIIYIANCGVAQPHATVTTDALGYYATGNLSDGRYLVVPNDAGYSFSKSYWVDIPQTEIQAYDFTAALITYGISGTVSGDLQEGITITLSGDSSATTTPGDGGSYSFTGLANGNYTITPSRTGYRFYPESEGITIADVDITGVDFTAVKTAQSFIMPIAICEDSILSDGQYNCNIGRVFNDNTDTARWTNFEGCDGGTPSSHDVSRLIDCDAGANPDPIVLGSGMATMNGVNALVSHRVHDCFFGDGTEPPRILEWTLPVIECDSAPTCGVVVGTVNVDIVWITESIDPAFYNAPTELWSADGEALLWQYADNSTSGEVQWADFVEYFNLQDVEGGEPALYRGKSIYFKPSCNDVDSK